MGNLLVNASLAAVRIKATVITLVLAFILEMNNAT